MKNFAEDDVQFLADLTRDTIESARVQPGQETIGIHEENEIHVKNTLGFSVIRPAGLQAYPAVWTQDFTMAYASALVPVEEGLNHLCLIASLQNDQGERHLYSGAVIPESAIPDHINLDRSPVFYPGTYSAGPDQGGEPWGICPPFNNDFDFVWLAYMLWMDTQDSDLFGENIAGATLLERLTRAYAVPTIDERTGIVWTRAERRSVGFIFCDSVYMTGHLLMATLERYRAARQLAEICAALGEKGQANGYRRDAESILSNLEQVFYDKEDHSGWLRAATGTSGQPDVWGTIYALYLDVLSPAVKKRAVTQILEDMDNGVILQNGALRHVPLNRDASAGSAWEKTVTKHNRYQNGAFWHTPVGWLIAVLNREHPRQAMVVFRDYIAHLRKHDFRKGSPCGAPWECIGWNGKANQNPAFVPSVALPYGILFGAR